MIRFFKVKKAVKNINPLSDSKATYYDEISGGGLKSDERPIKVCYLNGSILDAENLTTESDQTAIQKVFNSTLYNYSGLIIVKDKNNKITAPEYYCFLTIDKSAGFDDTVLYHPVDLIVYYDISMRAGFRVGLNWNLKKLQWEVRTNSCKLVLNEEDDLSDKNNYNSLPIVALLHKWEYRKFWVEANTRHRKMESLIVGSPFACPSEPVEIPMPTEDQIYETIAGKGYKKGTYDLLSMDFGTQVGENSYNTCQLCIGYSTNQINNFYRMNQLNGRAWLSTNYLKSQNIAVGIYFRIHDKNGKAIKHPYSLDLTDYVRLVAPFKTYYKVEENLIDYYEAGDLIRVVENIYFGDVENIVNRRLLCDDESKWNLIEYVGVSDMDSYTQPSIASLYPPIQMLNNEAGIGKDKKLYKDYFGDARWNWYRQIFRDMTNINEQLELKLVDLPKDFDKQPFMEKPENYIPIWDKFYINFCFSNTTGVGSVFTKDGSNYWQLSNSKVFLAYNSHIQLKYLLGKYMKRETL